MSINKVDLELLEKHYNSTRKYHTGHLVTGEEIRYHNVFSETKIKNLIKELHEMTLEDEKQEAPFFNEDGKLFEFTYFLIIKYFTDLGKQFPDGYENNIRTFSKLIELEMFLDIINNILPMEEIGKVNERIFEKIHIANKIEDLQNMFTTKENEKE